MPTRHTLITAATGVALGVLLGTGCARYSESAAGEVSAAEAASSVVLQVTNDASEPLELRTLSNGESKLVGSVIANDTTSILLDPLLFPTSTLFLAVVPASGVGRVIVGPLAAVKGDKIKFSIQPALEMSHAMVVR